MTKATPFQFVRDYETVKVEQEVPNEFLLVMDSGLDEDGTQRRAKGAYYKNIERKMLLKKKRVNVSPTSFLSLSTSLILVTATRDVRQVGCHQCNARPDESRRRG